MRVRNLIRSTIWVVAVLVCSMWMLASSRTPFNDDDPPQYSDWSATVNLGAPVNSVLEETDPYISKNGLSLYFTCNGCPGGFGGRDIYVSQRASKDEPWGPPQNLGPNLNSPFDEGSPALSVDSHRLYFNSNRPGSFGAGDIYVSRRHNKRDDFGWQTPENLGSGVNSIANEYQPCIFEDDETGIISLYFTLNRPGGMGGDDIYASTLQPDEAFGPAAPVLELGTSSEDRSVTIRRDGLELIFLSNRPGSILNAQGAPSFDLWVSTRDSSSDPWSPPVNLDPLGLLGINTRRHDGGPALSFDGTALYFHAAQRAANIGVGCPNASTCLFDIWMTTRTKLKNQNDDDSDRGEHSRDDGKHAQRDRD